MSWLKAWEGASALNKKQKKDMIFLYGNLWHNSCFFPKELGCARGIQATWSVNCLGLNIDLEIWEYCSFSSRRRSSLIWTMRYFGCDKGSHEFYLNCYKRELKKSHTGVILLEVPIWKFIFFILLEVSNFPGLYRRAHPTSTGSQQGITNPWTGSVPTSPASCASPLLIMTLMKATRCHCYIALIKLK